MKAALASVLLVGLVACGSKAAEEAPVATTTETATAEPVGSEVLAAAGADAPSPAVSGSAPDVSEPDYSKKNPDPHLAKQAALRDAMEFGMMGLLNRGAGGDPNAPTAPWGRDDSLDPGGLKARGNMWGDEIGKADGAGGLGLGGIGKGEGGGGRGEGIGLGNIGTLGRGAGTGSGGQAFGSGSGRLGGSSRSKPPSVRMGATSVSGRLPPEVIQRIVRQNFGRFRLCYENGLKNHPDLTGKVTVSFTIKNDGSVSDVKANTDMGDAAVASCVGKAFGGLSFPQPEGGVVKVSYPIMFSPGDAPASASSGGSAAGSAKAATPASPASTEPTIGGKALPEVTALEIEKALRDAGYTDVSSSTKPGSKAVIFSAKKGTHAFTLTFVAANAGADALPADEKKRLISDAKLFSAGNFFLAVESDDKTLAQSLLDAIIKKP
jgi:hypothetical protein